MKQIVQWHLSNDVVDNISTYLSVNFEDELEPSLQYGNSVEKGPFGEVNLERRDSSQAWIPSQCWIAALMWHYIVKANEENFQFDLEKIDEKLILGKNVLDQLSVSMRTAKGSKKEPGQLFREHANCERFAPDGE